MCSLKFFMHMCCISSKHIGKCGQAFNCLIAWDFIT